MKILGLFIFVGIVVALDMREEYDKYLKKYGKNYSKEMYEKRFETFMKNFIEFQNNQKNYEIGLTEFSDIPLSELRDNYLIQNVEQYLGLKGRNINIVTDSSYENI